MILQILHYSIDWFKSLSYTKDLVDQTNASNLVIIQNCRLTLVRVGSIKEALADFVSINH